MTTKTILASAISTAILAIAMPSQASSVTEFVKEGDVIAQLRIRNETVQQDNAKDDAIAMTARARLGYETPSMAGFKVLVEYDQVIALQDEYFSKNTSVGPDDTSKSVVADPATGDINRAQISYKSDVFGATLGRQRIIFDNARFIGNVGWRQNEQTFDAARIDVTAVDNLTATYAYVSQRNDILYNDIEVKDHLLNIGYKTPVGKVSTYAYLLEDDDSGKTYDTFGLRFKGKTALDALDLLYTAEYASQTNNSGADGAKDNDAAYSLIEGGVKVSGITLAAGMETLGGDGTYAFSTPYATGHAFNGWSDQFLGTPTKGLNDTYAKVVTKVAGIKLLAMYHDFASDKDGDDLGSEINLLAAKKFDKNFSAGIKFAQYSATDESGKVDTDKLWVWAEAKF
ncbi:MAG: alginate export family protein [Oleispira sp.]